MDCEEDIYTSPEPQAASTSTKQHPAAHMHTRRISKAPKSLKFKSKHTPRLLERPRRTTVSNTEVNGIWSVTPMGGKCPPFNANAGWMHDLTNQQIYMYGGLSPGDKSEIPTSELYVCDTPTMEWKNITVRGRYRSYPCLLSLPRILSNFGILITRLVRMIAMERQLDSHNSPNQAAPSSRSIIPALCLSLEDTTLKRTLRRPRSSS